MNKIIPPNLRNRLYLILDGVISQTKHPLNLVG
jgi:hypothetical protein